VSATKRKEDHETAFERRLRCGYVRRLRWQFRNDDDGQFGNQVDKQLSDDRLRDQQWFRNDRFINIRLTVGHDRFRNDRL